MFRIVALIFLCISFFITSCTTVHTPITQPVPIANLAHYKNYQPNVKKVIAKASVLSKENLTYKFGSANPDTGGMDCSGVIYYILKSLASTYIPRDSYSMYMWLLRHGKIHHVTTHNLHSNQFNALKPGDLLFWTGT